MDLRDYVWGYLVNNADFGLQILLLTAGYYRGPLLYSYVIQDLSWQMGFWFAAIPLGLCVLLVFFFVPEVRQSIPLCDLAMIAHR